MTNSPVILVENSTKRLLHKRDPLFKKTSVTQISQHFFNLTLLPQNDICEHRTSFRIVNIGPMNQPLGEGCPIVFTTIWRLRLLTFFPSSKPRCSPLPRFHTLCINGKKAWMRIASFLQTLDFHQISQHFFPNSKPGEAQKIAINPLP